MGNRRHACPDRIVAQCCRREPDSARPNRSATISRKVDHRPTPAPPGSQWNQFRRPKLGRRRLGAAAIVARNWRESTVTLLKWALIFFLVSIVAGILGFTGISAASADVARFLFYVFAVIFLVLLILGLTIFRV